MRNEGNLHQWPEHGHTESGADLAFLAAIEGIDGSGKGTQARRLCQHLRAAGETADLISFPRYEATLFGKAVGDFLNGRFGLLETVSPFLASLLYAGDRFESRNELLQAAERNDVLVIDRYVASNIAHQGAKLDGAERREFIEWIGRIEYEIFGLPKADLVVLLDLPAVQAQQLIARKQARSYTASAADIQEADADYLNRVRNVYLELARNEPNWYRLDCLADGEIRPVEDIADELRRVLAEKRMPREG